jgi:Prophage CP4-57 regulatory protein (AlpA)
MTKLLDYADLRQRGVKYSKCQLWRLWNAGKFPKPLKLSAVRNAWRADEIEHRRRPHRRPLACSLA